MKKLLIVFVLALLLCTNTYAAPSVSGVSGTISHGENVTISGSSFGTKTTAAPSVWDNCESGSPGDKWAYRPSGVSGTYAQSGAYRSKTTIDDLGSPYGGGVTLPHSNSTKYYCSNAYGTDGQRDESSLGKVVGNVDYFYASFYYQIDPNWTFNDGTDGNHKMFNMSTGSSSYDDTYAYWSFKCDSINQSDNVGMRDGVGWSNCDVFSCADVTVFNTGPEGEWVKIELLVHFSSSGFAATYGNNAEVFYTDCSGDPFPYTINFISVGGYHRDYGSANANAANWRYFDDIYFDTTLSRVMLANNATYASATITEPQIPSAWATGEITVKINQGALPDGTAYLFVFDSDNDANATGYAITLGDAENESLSLGGSQTITIVGSQTLTVQ